MSVFQGLAQGFECGARELGKFVQEEDAIVCQTYLPRLTRSAASDEGDVADGVVRRAEGTLGDERGGDTEFSRDGMELELFQLLVR